MRETLQEKLQKFNLLADTDIFHNLLGNASSVLFSKTHEYEHSGALMKTLLATLHAHLNRWSITTSIALRIYIILQTVRLVHAPIAGYFIIG